MQATTNDLDKATKRKICREFKKTSGDMDFVYSFRHGRKYWNGHYAFFLARECFDCCKERMEDAINGHDAEFRKWAFRRYFTWKQEMRTYIEHARKFASPLPLP